MLRSLLNNGPAIPACNNVNSIVCTAHLLPVFKVDMAIPREVNFSHTLDIFTAFYINKYIDYHAFETMF